MDAMMDNEVLEMVLEIATPGPLETLGGLVWENEPPAVLVNRVRQVLGVLYERDAVSLVSDAQYDRLGKWCGDAAATGMDWRSYPPQSIHMADSCLRAWKLRVHLGNQDCHECGTETWGLEHQCEESS